jgi:type IV secretion system protein VirB4
MALMALQFRRCAGAQIFAFEFGGLIGAAVLATGGDWRDFDIAVGLALRLRRQNSHAEKRWIAGC